MSTRIQVTSEELNTGATQMNAAGAQISAELSRLMAHTQSLTESWTGNASASFRGFYDQFNSNWSKCEEALKNIATMLNGAATSYDEAESSVASRFQA